MGARGRSSLRKAALVVLVLLGAGVSLPTGGLRAQEAAPQGGLTQTGTIPVHSPKARAPVKDAWPIASAPMLIDAAGRYGYQLFPETLPNGATLVTSVVLTDLDSGKMLGYVRLPHVIFGTQPSTPGPVAWAVDEEKHRLFLGIDPANDGSVVVIDAGKMKAGKDPILGVLEIPPSQRVLLLPGKYWSVKGLSLFKNPSDGRTKLLLSFRDGGANGARGDASPGAIPGLWVTQWDVERAIKASAAEDWGDWVPLLVGVCDDRGFVAALALAAAGADLSSLYPTPEQVVVAQVSMYRSVATNAINVGCIGMGGLKAIRLPLDASSRPRGSQEIFSGPSGKNMVATFADPGADRIHLIGKPRNSNAHEVWTLDMAAGRLVGRSSLTPLGVRGTESYGFDPRSGRLYVLMPHRKVRASSDPSAPEIVVPGGLMVVDGRLTPVPQPLVYADFAGPGAVGIAVDPGVGGRPRRAFVRRGTNEINIHNRAAPLPNTPPCVTYPEGKVENCPSDASWLVVEDDIPIPRPPAVADNDRFTVDAEEQEGLTGFSFEGSAGAYAARLRLVRGFRGLYSAGGNDAAWTLTGEPSCWPDDRVITLAPIEEAKLTPYQSTGRAVPVSFDSTSQQDVQTPVARCQPKKQVSQWLPGFSSAPGATQIDVEVEKLIKALDGVVGPPAENVLQETAECVGTGTSEKRQDDLSAVTDLSAKSTCSAGGAESTSSASLGLASLKIGDAFSSVSVRRDAKKGVVVRSESWVSGLRTGRGADAVAVDLVKAVAETWSNGRPSGAARGTYERVVCGVSTGGGAKSGCAKQAVSPACPLQVPVIPGDTDFQVPSGPSLRGQRDDLARRKTNLCDNEVSAMAAEFNEQSGSRMSMRVPTPDPAYLAGSPGGYIAAVQKGPAERFDDSVQNGDYSFEVPALEFVIEREQGRHILQLAAVRTASTYGIYLLPRAQSSLSAFGPSTLDDLTASAGGDANVLGAALSPAALGAPQASLTATRTSNGGLFGLQYASGPYRSLVIRSLREGALAASVWFSLLFPAMLATRRIVAKKAMKGRR